MSRFERAFHIAAATFDREFSATIDFAQFSSRLDYGHSRSGSRGSSSARRSSEFCHNERREIFALRLTARLIHAAAPFWLWGSCLNRSSPTACLG